MTRPQLIRTCHATLRWIVLATLICLVVGIGLNSDDLILLGLYSLSILLFILPVVLITLAVLNHRCRHEHTRSERLKLFGSNGILIAFWLVSCFPVFLFLALYQPWPVTMRHGPDTEFALEGYQSMIGSAPPTSVSEVYYRVDGLMHGSARLRFKTTDPGLAETMARRILLVQRPDYNWTGYTSDDPGWWKAMGESKDLVLYTHDESGPRGTFAGIWHDPVSGVVWFTLAD